MNVLFAMNLPWFPTLGGAGKANRMLMEGLARLGHRVRVVVPALATPSRHSFSEVRAELDRLGVQTALRDGSLTFIWNGVEVTAIEDATGLRKALLGEAQRFAPDAIVVSSEDPSHNLLDAALRSSSPVAYLVHTVLFLPVGPQAFFPSPTRAALLHQCAGIATVSGFVTEYIKTWAGVDSTPIPLPAFATPTAMGGFDADFVTLINPCAIKGLSILLGLARAMPETRFAAVPTWGTTPTDLAALRELSNITLLTATTDVDQIYARTRVLLFPSLVAEAYGLSIVEAMLRGIPVLASNLGGAPEAKLGTEFVLPVRPIERFEDRLDENFLPVAVAPPQDIEPWQRALETLLSDRARYEAHADDARARATHHVASLGPEAFEQWLRTIVSRPARVAAPSPPPAASVARTLEQMDPDQRAALIARLRAHKKSAPTPRATPRASASGPWPLSPGQQGLWFLAHAAPDDPAYNMVLQLRIAGPLQLAAFERSIAAIIARHDILRACFPAVDGQPVQAECEDRPSLRVATHAIADQLALEQHRIFDLSRGPLLHLTLLEQAPDAHVLVLGIHHLIWDGGSLPIFLAELAALYPAFAAGAPSPLAPLPLQYRDFAVREDPAIETSLAYWTRRFAVPPEPLRLPLDRPRSHAPIRRSVMQQIPIPRHHADALRRLARQTSSTLFTVLLAAFDILLHKYTGQEDITVGTPSSRPRESDLGGLIGYFVSSAAIRAEIDPSASAIGIIQIVRDAMLDAFANQAPFERVVAAVNPARGLEHPLFQVMFTYDESLQRDAEIGNLRFTDVPVDVTNVKFDLSMALDSRGGELVASLVGDLGLFDAGTLAQLLEHFGRVVQWMAEGSGEAVSSMSLVDGPSRRKLLDAWTRDSAVSMDRCIHEDIAAQAGRTPDAVAVVFGSTRLTYRELDERANQLAHHLIACGVRADEPVAVLLERSVDMVVSLLGILKAGAAFLPIDPTYPHERVRTIVADSRCRLVVGHSAWASVLEGSALIPIWLDRDATLAAHSKRSPAVVVEGDQLAYVLFTSGSSGRPKGVMITHAAIANHMGWMRAQFPLEHDDIVLHKTPFTFDASVWEFWAPLMAGAQLFIARPGGHRDPDYLACTIADERITVVQVVPSLLSALLDVATFAGTSLRRVFCGGETLTVELARRFHARLGCPLVNLYGPTEATIDVSAWVSVEPDTRGTIPIGHAVANTRLYVLDASLEPVPCGVSGELYVGGIQLARGYLGRPDLTAERFVPDPHDRAGRRMYRTGDLARYRSDGAFELLGRLDDQVKLRGYRIELGEIERVLANHPSVSRSVVVVRDVGGEPRLIAYVVAATRIDLDALRAHARDRLPEYMVPSAVVVLDEIPLLSSGKVNRSALPLPQDAAYQRAEYVAPRTPTEETLATIWAEILGVPRVGIHDSFFRIGGHSLLAIKLVARIKKTIGTELAVHDLFASPTIAGLLERASTEAAIAAPPIVRGPARATYPTSFQQAAVWNLRDSAIHLLDVSLSIRGPIDPRALEASLDAVVARHDVLRAIFEQTSDGLRQTILPHVSRRLLVLDRSSATEQDVLREHEALRAPFDLGNETPLRILGLMRLAPDHHVLALGVHHIAFDAWSAGVLARELEAHYRKFRGDRDARVPELTFQYGDYAAWQRQLPQTAYGRGQLAYWEHRLRGTHASSWPGPSDAPAQMQLCSFEPRVLEALDMFCTTHDATPFMAMFAAFVSLVRKTTGLTNFCVNSSYANRDRPGTEDLIGFFTNPVLYPFDSATTGSHAVFEEIRRSAPKNWSAADVHPTQFSNIPHAIAPFNFAYHRRAPTPATRALEIGPAPAKIAAETTWPIEIALFCSEPDRSEADQAMSAVICAKTVYVGAGGIEAMARAYVDQLWELVGDFRSRHA